MLKEIAMSFMIATTSANVTEVNTFREMEATCLAKNMYYEARNQGLAGQFAVSLVVMNRVKDDRYPHTICGVVEQGPTRESRKKNGVFDHIRNRCQFSWFCDGKSDEPKEKKVFSKMLDFSKSLVYDDIQIVDFTEGATHYHADYVYPAWRKTKTKTVEVADHIFYRWEK